MLEGRKCVAIKKFEQWHAHPFHSFHFLIVEVSPRGTACSSRGSFKQKILTLSCFEPILDLNQVREGITNLANEISL